MYRKLNFLRDEDKDICENEIKKLKLSNPDETTPQSDTNVGEQLEQDVKLWSDYLKTRFHPKTNVVLGKHFRTIFYFTFEEKSTKYIVFFSLIMKIFFDL